MRTPFLLALCTTVLLTACGGGASSPTQVAEQFLTHTNKMEFKEAKKYATKSTGEILDMIAGMAKMMGDNKEAKGFKITGETIDGDKATVNYRSDDKEADEQLQLIKEDGKWLVHMSKEDLDKEGGAGLEGGEEPDWSYDEEAGDEGLLEEELIEETAE